MCAQKSFLEMNLPAKPMTEKMVLWAAWNQKGDREVIREAAVKGHVDFVYKFLSERKKLSQTDTEQWFKEEILIWVHELLTRNQIFKASHILNNIKVDPTGEFIKIFIDTTNKNLRNYLGNHLTKSASLSHDLLVSWTLLDSIEKYNNVLINRIDDISSLNISKIDSQSADWRSEVGSQLFFLSLDNKLEHFVTSTNAWKYLLSANKTKLLKLWINVKFSNEPVSDAANETNRDKLINLFKRLDISSEMINLLIKDNLDINFETRDLLLNELSKFGIFSNGECNDLMCILRRFNETDSLNRLYDIIFQKTSCLTLNQFYKLLTDYCLKCNLHNVLNACTNNFEIFEDISKSYNLDALFLITDIRHTSRNLDNESVLKQNIITVSNYLCSNNLQAYCVANPIILLSLFIFTKDINYFDSSRSETNLPFDVNLDIFKHLPIFSLILNKNNVNNEIYDNKFTFYDLLKNHIYVDIDNIFAFRFKSLKIPNFNSPDLVQNFGYNKQINFLFYVKQCRPSIASKLFLVEEMKKYDASKRNCAVSKINKLALNNFANDEITCSCISFLEMIGESSEKLRTYISTANILYQSQQYTYEDLVDLFKNVENISLTISSLLENILIKEIEFNPYKISESFRKYSIIVKFNLIHNLPLPELFLKHCACNNLWLPFLIFAQIKNYPLEQIKKLVQNFKNTNLLDHISHCVCHDIQIDEQKNVWMRDRDSRKAFLSRVGVRKNIETSSQGSESLQSSITSQSSFGSNTSSSGNSDLAENDNMDLKTTLLQILIRCHNSTDPPKTLLQACQLYRNPLLAVLATSYEPDSIVINWLTWLGVSCEITDYYETLTVCGNSVKEFLKTVLKHGFCKTLLQSFEIFLPDNPLKVFIEILYECTLLNFNDIILLEKVQMFKNKMLNTRNNSVIFDVDHEMTYLNNRTWLENVAFSLLTYALEYNFASLYNQIRFIDILCKININQCFLDECPNFCNIFKILSILLEYNCDTKLNLAVISNNGSYKETVEKCIYELVKCNRYNVAFNIACTEGISCDQVLISEWKNKYRDRDENFWNECNEALKQSKVTSINALNLYIECAELSDNDLEKYKILTLAHEWVSVTDFTNLFYVEKQMWELYLSLDVKARFINIHNESSSLTYKDMKVILETMPESTKTLTSNDKVELNKIICVLLNNGNFWQALRVEKIFSFSNTDLQILKLCCSLAEGIVLPHQLTTEQRLLLNKGRNRKFSHRRRTFKSTRLSSISSSSHSPVNSLIHITDHVDSPIQDTLIILETLTEKLQSGVEFGQYVFLSYRISVNIEIPYHLVIENIDHMKMLKDALDDDCKNKIEVIHDFMVVYKWSKEELADFVCDELITAIMFHIRNKTEVIKLWDLSLSHEFHFILQLFQENCSILGTKIFSKACDLHQSNEVVNENIKISEIALLIELIIFAHDCFTADCNMEGISFVLKKCQTIISLLLTLKSWKLIVRLLTGVARYTEMSYAFQILRENDQFEFLLSKGSKKDVGLKVALLEYLKKYCPDNRELYRIVALHFTLFSEVAELWEKEARSIVKNLIAISKLEMQNYKLNPDTEKYVLFTNTDGTRICLNKAMENYTHAAEYHIHGEKLLKAMNAAKQAELIALQMSRLKGLASNGTTVCLLNLNDTQIASILCSDLSFEQALMLTEAYNYQADWATILFEQYVVRNHCAYLNSFLKHLHLTDSIVHDISRRFLSVRTHTAVSVRNMKDILVRVPSVHTKYRIASELGFIDVVEDLINGNNLVFLKDTVWKQGYKN